MSQQVDWLSRGVALVAALVATLAMAGCSSADARHHACDELRLALAARDPAAAADHVAKAVKLADNLRDSDPMKKPLLALGAEDTVSPLAVADLSDQHCSMYR